MFQILYIYVHLARLNQATTVESYINVVEFPKKQHTTKPLNFTQLTLKLPTNQ